MATKAKRKVSKSNGKVKVAKAAKPATIHIKGRADKDTFCGGSHSPIWYKAAQKLTTVEPRYAKKIASKPEACGRCLRVARSKED